MYGNNRRLNQKYLNYLNSLNPQHQNITGKEPALSQDGVEIPPHGKVQEDGCCESSDSKMVSNHQDQSERECTQIPDIPLPNEPELEVSSESAKTAFEDTGSPGTRIFSSPFGSNAILLLLIIFIIFIFPILF